MFGNIFIKAVDTTTKHTGYDFNKICMKYKNIVTSRCYAMNGFLLMS
jgi:hypothetical protein